MRRTINGKELCASFPEIVHRWFFRWRDKSFSFTDCTSLVVMKELRIGQALTSARHFVHAGFESLPK